MAIFTYIGENWLGKKACTTQVSRLYKKYQTLEIPNSIVEERQQIPKMNEKHYPHVVLKQRP